MFALNLPTRSQEGNQLAVLPKNTSEPSLGTSATIGCDSGKAARNPPWERWQSWELEQLPFPQQLPFPPGSSSLSSPACHTQHLHQQEWRSIPSLGEADSSWIHSLQSREDCCHQPGCTSGHNIKAKVLQITSPQGHHKMLGQNLSIPVLPAVPRTHTWVSDRAAGGKPGHGSSPEEGWREHTQVYPCKTSSGWTNSVPPVLWGKKTKLCN